MKNELGPLHHRILRLVEKHGWTTKSRAVDELGDPIQTINGRFSELWPSVIIEIRPKRILQNPAKEIFQLRPITTHTSQLQNSRCWSS